jgi:hypothetical protein
VKTMSAKEIKDRYGAFAETARREAVVHTSHGRPTLVTISIDRARAIPQLRSELGAATCADDRQERLKRLLAKGGIGVRLIGESSVAEMNKRSRSFRD